LEPSQLISRRPSRSITGWCGAGLVGSAMLAVLLAGCERSDQTEARPDPIRPVRVVTVEALPGGETVTLTGTVRAQDNVNLSFRVGGQLIERLVNLGDSVRTGQVVARLDAETARNAVQASRANLAAAMARLTEARNEVQRFEPLLQRGFVSRQMFDRAVEAQQAAQAMVDTAEAKLRTAEHQLEWTELRADGPGVVTAVRAEPGEVVGAGQPVVELAREGGRDAVFDVPERVMEAASAYDEVKVVLSSAPSARTTGRVREASPQADPVTRTFEVRVGLADQPAAMRLGSTVTGTLRIGGAPGMEVPASALTAINGAPAVWVLDRSDDRVALRNVEVVRYELDRVLIGQGLDEGELVVTAGVQTLRPGQQVRLLGDAPPAVPPLGAADGLPADATIELEVPAEAGTEPAADAQADVDAATGDGANDTAAQDATGDAE
jgi:RND family efflux transporter MFP subunit